MLAVNSGKKGRSSSRNKIIRKSGVQEGITVEENNSYISLNEISMDPLGNRMLVRGGGVTPPAPTPLYSMQASIDK